MVANARDAPPGRHCARRESPNAGSPDTGLSARYVRVLIHLMTSQDYHMRR